MLEQANIPLKGLNIDKLKAEYRGLTAQKKELTATYQNCEKKPHNHNPINYIISNFIGKSTLENEKNA